MKSELYKFRQINMIENFVSQKFLTEGNWTLNTCYNYIIGLEIVQSKT